METNTSPYPLQLTGELAPKLSPEGAPPAPRVAVVEQELRLRRVRRPRGVVTLDALVQSRRVQERNSTAELAHPRDHRGVELRSAAGEPMGGCDHGERRRGGPGSFEGV